MSDDPAETDSRGRLPLRRPAPGDPPVILHASAVALNGRAALILGAAGSGKSGLALALMALGAGLIADDRVILTPGPNGSVAAAPPAIAGLIEARGFGLLHAAPAGPTPLALILDLDRTEPARMPPPRAWQIFGHLVPLFHNPESGQAAPAIMQYLRGGGCQR